MYKMFYVEGSDFSSEKGTFPLRKHLLKWVMLILTVPSPSVREWTKARCQDVAFLLIQLILREPSSLVKCCAQRNDGVNSSSSQSVIDGIVLNNASTTKQQSTSKIFQSRTYKDLTTPVERTYLLTTFDCPLEFEMKKSEYGGGVEGVVTEGCHVIPELLHCLLETLQTVMQAHVEYAEAQASSMKITFEFFMCIQKYFNLVVRERREDFANTADDVNSVVGESL
jgi:hypothetical protein